MDRLRLPLLFVLIAALGTTLLWLWLGADPRRPAPSAGAELQGIALPQPQALPEFRLVDFDGQPLTERWFKGGWTFVFFGYTHCPDICPTTLYTLQQVHQHLESTPALRADTRFLFISLDPRRDTPAILKDYVQHFHPTFVAASGDRPVLDHLTAALNIAYAIEGEDAQDNYLVNHSAAILLIDSAGRYHARFTPTQSPAQISDSYARLRALNHR